MPDCESGGVAQRTCQSPCPSFLSSMTGGTSAELRVATALPSMTDVVGPECGAVVPVDDAAAFAEALEQALGHVWDRSAIRHRAAAWRWDRNAEDTLDVLTAVVGERRAA